MCSGKILNRCRDVFFEQNLVHVVKMVKTQTFAFIGGERVGIVLKGVKSFEISASDTEKAGILRASHSASPLIIATGDTDRV
jgi:hypothetical protein